MSRNYYEILGIDKDATQSEIKKNFRLLAKKYHPDISKEADAEERFKEIQEAYEVLSDEQKRTTYDRMGHNTYTSNNTYTNYGYEDYSYYRGGPSFEFTNINIKEWFLKKTLFEKILYILLAIVAAFILVIIGIFLLILAAFIFLIYILIKAIKMIIK